MTILTHRPGRQSLVVASEPATLAHQPYCSLRSAGMHVSPHRILKPRYRAPGSDHWEEKDWDFVLDRIAHRVKETRDRDFMEKNAKGQTVNRVETIFQLGTSQMDNEECAVSHQMIRSLGVVYFDHQARI